VFWSQTILQNGFKQIYMYMNVFVHVVVYQGYVTGEGEPPIIVWNCQY